MIGVPDDSLGEEVGAAVVLKPAATVTADEIRDFVKAQVAAYKYPRHVWLLPALPKGPTGKMLKREIRPPVERGGAMTGRRPTPAHGRRRQHRRAAGRAARRRRVRPVAAVPAGRVDREAGRSPGEAAGGEPYGGCPRSRRSSAGSARAGRSSHPAPRDRRFADQAWTQNPLLRRVVQAYLATGRTVEQLIADADLAWRDDQRVRFLAENLVEALAPSNVPLLNPASAKEAIDTAGLSFVRGARNLVRDLARPPRVPQMVDTSAFTVGENLAATPGAVVLRTEVFELIQYAPQTTDRPRGAAAAWSRRRSTSTTPSTWPRAAAGSSTWCGRDSRRSRCPGATPTPGTPTGAWTRTCRRSWTRSTRSRASRRTDRAVLTGICSGGILASLAAVAPRRHRPPGRPRARRVTVLDHRQAGMPAALADRYLAAAATALSRRRGYLDGRVLGEVFAWLRPGDLIWNYWVNNYLLGRAPPAFDVLYWNADTTRMSARLHADFVDMAMHNRLTKPGAATVLGRPVDLRQVTVDAYVVAGVADHITPWQSCYRTLSMLGGETRFVLSTSGHIAALVNPPGNPKATYQVNSDSRPSRSAGVAAAARPPSRAAGGRTSSPGSASAPAASGRRRESSAAAATRRWSRRPAPTSSTAEGRHGRRRRKVPWAPTTSASPTSSRPTSGTTGGRTRDFVDHEVLPVINDYWERAEFPWPLIERLAELGIVGDGIEGYGCPPMSPIATGLVHMELNRGDGSLGTFLGIQSGLAMRSIAMLGSQGAAATMAAAHGTAEEARRLRAHRAGARVGLGRRWRRRHAATATPGSSTAASGGSATAPSPTWSCSGRGTPPTTRSRASWSRRTLRATRPAASTARDRCARCGRPRSTWSTYGSRRRTGCPEARSFADAAAVLAGTRNTVAWAALGHATAAYDAAMTYCRDRVQFGKPLVGFQIVQQRLVTMLAELCGMQLYCLRLGRLIEEGRFSDTIAALAKMHNTRKARRSHRHRTGSAGRQRHPARLPRDAAHGRHGGDSHL